jgi:hypothetical protein
MEYSKVKLKSSGDKASPCYKPYWIGKLSDKMFTCMDFTVCLILTHFNQPYSFQGESKLY